MKPILRLLAYLDRLANDKWFKGRFESISGRCWRRIMTKQCRLCGWLCRALDKIDPDHCHKAHHSDVKINPTIPRISGEEYR